MKTSFLALLASLLFVSFVAAATKKGPGSENSSSETPRSHPLKGVVVAVDANESALRVKHEEIPGVMRAMTMQFKVDAATLKAVKVGDAITGQMSRGDVAWRLTDVKVVAAKKD